MFRGPCHWRPTNMCFVIENRGLLKIGSFPTNQEERENSQQGRMRSFLMNNTELISIFDGLSRRKTVK